MTEYVKMMVNSFSCTLHAQSLGDNYLEEYNTFNIMLPFTI